MNNSLSSYASLLTKRGISFVWEDGLLCSKVKGVSETGHKFSCSLTIQKIEGERYASCIGGFEDDLIGIDPEKAIKEYCYRASQIRISDGI